MRTMRQPAHGQAGTARLASSGRFWYGGPDLPLKRECEMPRIPVAFALAVGAGTTVAVAQITWDGSTGNKLWKDYVILFLTSSCLMS